jgi:hypothetical protein
LEIILSRFTTEESSKFLQLFVISDKVSIIEKILQFSLLFGLVSLSFSSAIDKETSMTFKELFKVSEVKHHELLAIPIDILLPFSQLPVASTNSLLLSCIKSTSVFCQIFDFALSQANDIALDVIVSLILSVPNISLATFENFLPSQFLSNIELNHSNFSYSIVVSGLLSFSLSDIHSLNLVRVLRINYCKLFRKCIIGIHQYQTNKNISNNNEIVECCGIDNISGLCSCICNSISLITNARTNSDSSIEWCTELLNILVTIGIFFFIFL